MCLKLSFYSAIRRTKFIQNVKSFQFGLYELLTVQVNVMKNLYLNEGFGPIQDSKRTKCQTDEGRARCFKLKRSECCLLYEWHGRPVLRCRVMILLQIQQTYRFRCLCFILDIGNIPVPLDILLRYLVKRFEDIAGISIV